MWMAPWAEAASAAQRKTADHAPSLALTGSRPPLGDYLAPGVPPPTIARVYHGNVSGLAIACPPYARRQAWLRAEVEG